MFVTVAVEVTVFVLVVVTVGVAVTVAVVVTAGQEEQPVAPLLSPSMKCPIWPLLLPPNADKLGEMNIGPVKQADADPAVPPVT